MILRKKSCAIMAYALAFFAMLLTQTSCVYDNNSAVLCDSEDTEALVINLNLTVPSSSAGTRSAATDAENYIDIQNDDYEICVFDKNGAYAGDKLTAIDCTENGVSGGRVSYTLTATLRLSSNEDKKNLSKFRVMVLANWVSFERSNTDSSYNYPQFTGYNLNNIYSDGEHFNFKFKGQGDNNNVSWAPSISYDSSEQSKAIPMFGVTDDLDLQYVLDMAKYGDGPIFNVPMLRAVAKVEIIDEIGDKIGSVSMSDANAFGRFIPDIEANPDWSTDPVKTPSLPTDAGTISKIGFVQGPKTSDEKSTWVAYIPEMDLTEKRPEFTIYDGQTPLPSTPFTNYGEDKKPVDDKSDKALKSVLRNHIYRYNVTIDDSGIEITSEVLPWDMEYDDSPIYFDTPKVAEGGWLKWKTEYADDDDVDDEFKGQPNGYKYDSETLVLIMKSALDDYAQATFTLEAPKNGRWYAALVNNTGKSDAFYFVDEAGVEITENNGNPSGVIDGTQATIRLKVRRESVSDRNNECRLVIMVEYPDKSVREVKVIEGSDGNVTIIQERTDIYG